MRARAALVATAILLAGCSPKPIFRADPEHTSGAQDTRDPRESQAPRGTPTESTSPAPSQGEASPSPATPLDPSHSGSSRISANRVEEVASTWFGVPYRYGGVDERGIDCSGLVQNVFGDLGTSLPRTTRAQVGRGREISLSEVRAGDLLFFRLGSPLIDHVGIALGRDRFVHSSTSRGVVVDYLMDDYFARRFVQARRVLGTN